MTIPLSLYIHIPWCVKKCPYCDFNSHAFREEIPEKKYIEKLLEDVDKELPSIWGRRIQTIFFGGGTPSLFSPESLDHLLKQLHARFSYSPNTEITLEANPGTVEQGKFKAYREVGINRLSLGIQSFHANKLRLLGRIHDDTEAKKAVTMAKCAGFTNFNIDLMFGLPEQTIDNALFDLETAISYQPTHLSWYQLTLEPNTHFSRFPPSLPDDDYIFEMQEQGQAVIKTAGYDQYEISAYSQKGYNCQHNRNYWEFGDYLGIGAGAHSKITNAASGIITRKWKIKHPKQYLNASDFTAGQNRISLADLPLEFMMNALRLYEEIPFSLLEERTGLTADCLHNKLDQAKKAGLLEINDRCFYTTPLGKRFYNDLLQHFSNE